MNVNQTLLTWPTPKFLAFPLNLYSYRQMDGCRNQLFMPLHLCRPTRLEFSKYSHFGCLLSQVNGQRGRKGDHQVDIKHSLHMPQQEASKLSKFSHVWVSTQIERKMYLQRYTTRPTLHATQRSPIVPPWQALKLLNFYIFLTLLRKAGHRERMCVCVCVCVCEERETNSLNRVQGLGLCDMECSTVGRTTSPNEARAFPGS